MAQIQKKTSADVGDQTTHTIVLDSNPIQGNMIVLCISSNVFVSSPPSGYTNLITQNDFLALYVYYKIAGASESATISFTSVAGTAAMIAFEYSNMTAADKSSNAIGQGGAGTIDTGTTGTTVSPTEIAFAVAAFRLNEGASSVSSWSNGFTSEGHNGSVGAGDADVYIDVATKTLSSTGTVNSVATLNAAGGSNNVGGMATFITVSPQIIAWIRA